MSVRVRASISAGSDSAAWYVLHVEERDETDHERLFERSPDLACVTDDHGRLEYVNPAWECTLGWTRDELIGTRWLELVHPEDQPRVLLELACLASGESVAPFESRHRCRDGSWRHLSWNVSPERDGRRIYGMGRDTSELQEREDELKQAILDRNAIVAELRRAIDKVQVLRRRMLTVCAWTKRIRQGDDWVPLEEFMARQLEVELTHGISEEGLLKLKGE